MKKFKILFFSIQIFFIIPVYADVIELVEGYEYNWDVHRDNIYGNAIVIPEEGWKFYNRYRPIPDRKNRSFVFVRIKLPQFQMRDPALKLFMDLSYECYFDKKLYHSFGKVRGKEQEVFQGFNMLNILPLENKFSGQFLYFLIRSDYHSIGPSSPTFLGEKEKLYIHEIKEEAPKSFLVFFFLTCSFITFYFFIRDRTQKLLYYFSLLSLFVGLICAYHLSFRLLFLNFPIIWTYLSGILMGFSPYIVFRFLESAFGGGYKNSLTVIRRLHLVLFFYFSMGGLYFGVTSRYSQLVETPFFYFPMFIYSGYNCQFNTIYKWRE